MHPKTPLALALTAALAVPLVAQAQNFPGQSWLNMPPPPAGTHHYDDPRVAEMLRWLESQRSGAGTSRGEFPFGAMPQPWMQFTPDYAPPVARAAVDGNHDGGVSDEEASAHAEAVFVSMDRDGDGVLSEDEVAVRRGPTPFAGGSEAEGQGEGPDGRFAALDGNADGSVTKAEFLDVAFAHYEAARDPVTGEVSPWSYRRRDWY